MSLVEWNPFRDIDNFEYRDGILSVIVPKVEQAKMKGRRIDIQ